MIKRFEVTAKGMNVCGAWDIDKEHCSPIAWLFEHTGLFYTTMGQ